MFQRISRRRFIRAVALAPIAFSLPARAEDPANIGSVTSIAPRMAMQGKLATKTEILAGQGQAPMLTLGSLEALQGAIAQYDEIVAGGGWPLLPPGHYDKTAKPARIILLRQRLVREGYLDFDTLAGNAASQWDAGIATAIQRLSI